MIRGRTLSRTRLPIAAVPLLFACGSAGTADLEHELDGSRSPSARDISESDASAGVRTTEDCGASGQQVDGTVWPGPCFDHRSAWNSFNDTGSAFDWLYRTSHHSYASTGLPAMIVTDLYTSPDIEVYAAILPGTTDQVQFFEYDERRRLTFHRTQFRNTDEYWPESRDEAIPFPEIPVDFTDWSVVSAARWYRDDDLGRLHMFADDDLIRVQERPANPTKNLSIYEYIGDTALVRREIHGMFEVQENGTWGIRRSHRRVTDFEYDGQGRLVRKTETNGALGGDGEYVWVPGTVTSYEYGRDGLAIEEEVRFDAEAVSPRWRHTVNYRYCPDKTCTWRIAPDSPSDASSVRRFNVGRLAQVSTYYADYLDGVSTQYAYDAAGNLLMIHEAYMPNGYANTVYDYSCWDGTHPITPPSWARPVWPTPNSNSF